MLAGACVLRAACSARMVSQMVFPHKYIFPAPLFRPAVIYHHSKRQRAGFSGVRWFDDCSLMGWLICRNIPAPVCR